MVGGVEPAQDSIAAGLTIEFRRISKSYGNAYALRNIDLILQGGLVHALLGENGAGKSTLVKILSGQIAPSEGALLLNGHEVVFRSVRDAERHGITIVPQEITITPNLSVADFMYLGRECTSAMGVVSRRQSLVRAQDDLRKFNLDIDPRTPMYKLTAGQAQLVSIAIAISKGAKVLILDEPTSSLTGHESERLFEHIERLSSEGVTTIYISHRLPEIARLAQHISVLRDGELVGERDVTTEAAKSAELVHLMLGRELNELYPNVDRTPGETILSVRTLSVLDEAKMRREVNELSFEVRGGEVLGIYGGIGSGVHVVASALFGAIPDRTSAEIALHGESFATRNPQTSIKRGLAFLTADRKANGMIPDRSILENVTLAALDHLFRGPVLRPRSEYQMVQRSVTNLKVKCTSVEQPIKQLSGGNQQKVLVAKWLALQPHVLILEEPTRGVDVGARVDIYNAIDEIAKSGVAVLVMSTDIAEIVGISDRVIALDRGTAQGEWQRPNITQKQILSALGNTVELEATQ